MPFVPAMRASFGSTTQSVTTIRTKMFLPTNSMSFSAWELRNLEQLVREARRLQGLSLEEGSHVRAKRDAMTGVAQMIPPERGENRKSRELHGRDAEITRVEAHVVG